tara:strand:+ start:367 stop:594 length:228 start_codon:yes stop_codon:yes gene_type:complete
VEAIMALDMGKNTARLSDRIHFSNDLRETTFFEWLDEAMTFAGDNQTSDVQTLKLQTGEGRTKEMYAVRVHPRDA